MEKEKGQSHLWSVVVVAIIMGAYVLSGLFDGPVAANAGVTYRYDKGVVLQCVLDWEPSGLEELSATAKNMQAPVSFFVSIDLLLKDPQFPQRASEYGWETGLLLTGAPQEFEGEIRAGKALLKDLKYVTAADVTQSDALGQAAKAQGVQAVLCTFSLKNNTSDVSALVSRIEKESFDGAIIRINPAKTTVDAFSQIVDVIRSKGYDIVKLTNES